MNKLLLIGCLALTGAPALTAKSFHVDLPSRQKEILSSVGSQTSVMRYQADRSVLDLVSAGSGKDAKRADKKEAGETIMVTCILEPSSDGRYSPVSAYALANDEGGDTEIDYIDNSGSIEVPKGTYNVIGLYQIDQNLEEAYYLPTWAIVIRENVVANEDIEVIMNADEATHQIKFRQKLPDGSDLLLPEILEFGNDGKPVFNKDENSWNVSQMLINNYIVNDDGSSLSFALGASSRMSTGESGEGTCDFLVNDISDSWTMIQDRTPFSAKDNFYMVFSTKGISKELIMAETADYHHYQPPYVHTNVGLDPDTKKAIGALQGFLWNGNLITSSYIVPQKSGPGIDLPDWYFYGTPATDVTPFIFPFLKDGDINVYGNDFEALLVGAPFTLKDNVATYPIIGSEFPNLSSARMMIFLYDEDGNYPALDTGHPVFSYTDKDIYTAYGNSVPVLSVSNQDFGTLMGMTDRKFIIPITYYTGRLGENRISDNVMMNFSIALNGETLAEDYNSDFMMFHFMSLIENGIGTGDWTLTFTDNNITVDGMEGVNKTEMGYNDTLEDAFAPTLRFLQFRDADGTLTDRFNKPEEGMFYLAGSDYFCYPMSDMTGCFMQPSPVMEISVEYAPYGTEDYEALSVSEMPEIGVTSQLGQTYCGSLEDIARTSGNGWFDMRVTLTDESGNYQKQTISPAFKISSLSGIGNVADSNSAVRIDGRNIIAPAGSDIYTIQGLLSDGIDVEPGIYIVRTGSGVSKVIVR